MKKKLTAWLLILAVGVSLCVSFAACGPATDEPKDPYIKSVEVVTQPTKTEYFEGEIFNPAGLTFKTTWVVDGADDVKTNTFADCSGWTNKDIALTAAVTKITFTVSGYNFDVNITVKSLAGATLSCNTASLAADYTTKEAIDFSGIIVSLNVNGSSATLAASDYKLYDGSTLIEVANRSAYLAAAGTRTFKVTYLGLEKPFNVTVIDASHADYVKSVSVLTQPTKTEYFEGEIFNPAGLTFNSTWVIEGREKVKANTYADCSAWTSKNVALTDLVTKITFTVGGFDFDVNISVTSLDGYSLIGDFSSILAEYTTEDVINFTGISVYFKDPDNNYKTLTDEYDLYDGDVLIEAANRSAYTAAEGERIFKIKYLGLEATFGTTVIDREKSIYPKHIQAENNTFYYDVDGKETATPWTQKENISWYEKKEGTVSTQILRIAHGAEGYAISNIGVLTTYFIKFNVYVPEAGEYELLTRAQSTSVAALNGCLKVNLNGEKDGDGDFIYNELSTSDRILGGNQRYGSDGIMDGTAWLNMYYWTTARLGTFNLNKGDNVIRLQPTGTVAVPNIDYFEVQRTGTQLSSEPQVVSERTGEGIVLGANNAIYLTKGTKLGDITGIPEQYPEHYTLIYLRLTDYVDKVGNTAYIEEVPITEEQITGIDYTKTGEQTATITYTSAKNTTWTATFKVIITQ